MLRRVTHRYAFRVRRPSVVDLNGDASVVTDPDERAERQRAMRIGHCSAIQSLAVSGAVAAETIASAVDACNFGTAKLRP